MLTKYRNELVNEIKSLEQKIEGLRQEIVLSDGALQAFKYVLVKVEEDLKADEAVENDIIYSVEDTHE